MASSFTTVDLSKLPLPAVVEQIDFEVILQQMLADLIARDPAFTALVESDPAFKVLEACAYREMLIRQRVNEAAKAVMLAYAIGGDLDVIGGTFNVERLLLVDANDEATPPIAAVYESDEDFRRRIQLSFEGYTTAGSEGSYVFHALSADGDVKDVSATSPTPGQVNVYVLSRVGPGTASGDLLDAVEAALNADDTRPMTDNVFVASAAIVNYAIEAELILYPGPDAEVVRQAALDAITAHVSNIKRLGLDVALSAIYAQLQQPGVQQVNLALPLANIPIELSEAGHCTGITLTVSANRNE
ncbi:MAG TPA: baseplate J/gp47 family protein [Abditibacteriaceae bacterium]|jgi:phage-related baseplate assembly protein